MQAQQVVLRLEEAADNESALYDAAAVDRARSDNNTSIYNDGDYNHYDSDGSENHDPRSGGGRLPSIAIKSRSAAAIVASTSFMITVRARQS